MSRPATIQQKKSRLAGKMSFSVAEAANDPLMKKLRRAQSVVKLLKDKISAKYGSKGAVAATKALAKM